MRDEKGSIMTTTDENSGPRFYSVAEAARSSAPRRSRCTERSAGEFPAVRIRGRLIVPAKALEAMTATTITNGSLVDAAEWTSAARGLVGDGQRGLLILGAVLAPSSARRPGRLPGLWCSR